MVQINHFKKKKTREEERERESRVFQKFFYYKIKKKKFYKIQKRTYLFEMYLRFYNFKRTLYLLSNNIFISNIYYVRHKYSILFSLYFDIPSIRNESRIQSLGRGSCADRKQFSSAINSRERPGKLRKVSSLGVYANTPSVTLCNPVSRRNVRRGREAGSDEG